jgi:hypothetical protein
VLLAALMAAAVRAVASRRLDPVLLGLAGAFAFFVLFVGAKSEFYLILYYTWWTLLLAGMVGWLVVRLPRLGPALAVLAVLLAPLVFGLQESYEDIQTAVDTYRERGYYALIGDIRAVVPPGATILAPPLYWIGLHDHPYTDYYVWERLRAERRERFSSYVARLKPDLVVLDAKSRHQVSINSPGFLEANATLLTTVRRVGFDRVEVWKLL